MAWTPLPRALAVIFLDYLCATGKETVGPTFFCDSNSDGLATTLGNAISFKEGRLHELFVERLAHGRAVSRVKMVFSGKNFYGKGASERRIFVRSDFLPPDCIDLYWVWHGDKQVLDLEVIRDLTYRVRKSLGIPIEPARPVGEGSPPTPPAEEIQSPPAPAPPSTTETVGTATSLSEFPELEARREQISAALAEGRTIAEISLLLKAENVPTTIQRVQVFCQATAIAQSNTQAQSPLGATIEPVESPEPKLPPAPSKPEQLSIQPTAAAPPLSEPTTRRPAAEKVACESGAQAQIEPLYTSPRVPPIAPQLFEIRNPDRLAWNDSMGLLDLADDDSQDDLWRLKDACEAVLILGAPGSGKTSATGFAFASAFLSAGFGGLVLAAKPEEARRWQKLCARLGREKDCIVVTRDGPFKLNALAYETQRPGERPGMTDDLISFFRVLIAIVSKRTASQGKDDFWTNATNQLMRELFDVFLLADEPMTIDGLTKFVTKAPEKPTENWTRIPFFGDILQRAGKGIRCAEDQRIYERVQDYWTVAYPSIAHQTRSGIVLGFTAMANALSGRGIHNLISSETTLTPEMILSGKIVILDLPLKDCGQGGLLIQAAWKYLFQRAVERRADKGLETARPVFLWEDEGHLFFSQHDIDFQPTARDCRAAHVILSQSLHNFYQLGHNPHAVRGVFATMNTQIFHANGDLETNQWASDKLGTSLKTLVNVSISSQPKRPPQPNHWLLDLFNQEERESIPSTSVNQHREKAFPPERFTQLKKGGDGSCEAVILWVSHKFKANGDRPFRVKIFAQDDNQP